MLTTRVVWVAIFHIFIERVALFNMAALGLTWSGNTLIINAMPPQFVHECLPVSQWRTFSVAAVDESVSVSKLTVRKDFFGIESILPLATRILIHRLYFCHHPTVNTWPDINPSILLVPPSNWKYLIFFCRMN